MFLLADYIQQSQGSDNTVDYHNTPVFAFIRTTRASIFCKGKQVFSVDKTEIKKQLWNFQSIIMFSYKS